MKAYLLLLLAAGLGYYGYQHWNTPAPVPTPAPPLVEVPQPSPVPFAVRARVKRMLAEWKRLSLSDQSSQRGVATVKIDEEMRQIRAELYKQGRHDEASLRQLLLQAITELGHDPKQANYLTDELMAHGAR